jgi:ribonuclease BN (tRNA processing enzyme)
MELRAVPERGLRLTVLGCSGSYPGPGGACSGYLVEGGGVRVVLDLGSGSLANLQHHIGLGDIDAVVLSHQHPDHWVDLTGLRVAMRFGSGREGLPVYLTEGTLGLAIELCGELAPTFALHVVGDGDQVAIGGLDVRFAATQHFVPTLAPRFDAPGGASLAYSADTGPGWSFSSLGDGIDLALCEATVTAELEHTQGGGHLSARQAGRMAARAGVRRLVLTHLLPTVDVEHIRAEGSEAFGAPVEVASVGASFDV